MGGPGTAYSPFPYSLPTLTSKPEVATTWIARNGWMMTRWTTWQHKQWKDDTAGETKTWQAAWPHDRPKDEDDGPNNDRVGSTPMQTAKEQDSKLSADANNPTMTRTAECQYRGPNNMGMAQRLHSELNANVKHPMITWQGSMQTW